MKHCWLTFLNEDVIGEILSHLNYLSWCQLKNANKEHFNLLNHGNFKNKIPEKLSFFKTIDSLACDYTESAAYELLYYSNGKLVKNNWIWIGAHFYSSPDYVSSLWTLFGSGEKEPESFLEYFVRSPFSDYGRYGVKCLVKNNKSRFLDNYMSNSSVLCHLIIYALKYHKIDILDKYNRVILSSYTTRFDYYLASYDDVAKIKYYYKFFDAEYNLSYYEGLVHYNKVETIKSLLSKNQISSSIAKVIVEKAIKENKIPIIEEIIKKDRSIISRIQNTENWYVYCRDETMVKFLISIGINWYTSPKTCDLIRITNKKYPQSRSIQYNKYFSDIDVWFSIKATVPPSLNVLEKIVMMLGKLSTSPPNYFPNRLKNFSQEEKAILQKHGVECYN